MKKLIRLSLPFFFCTNTSIAQQRLEYANFIQSDTAIKWAAIYNSYINLTPANPNFNIRNFYVNKLKRQGSTAYWEDTAAFTVSPRHIDYNEFRSAIKKVAYDPTKMNWFFNFDEKSDVSRILFDKESNSCDTCLQNNKFSFFKVKQLLYYKKNRLQIRNILISPVIYKKTDATHKESTEFFESSEFAFDEIKNDDAMIPASAKFIARACNDLVLLPSPASNVSESNILTLKNWNLSDLLYQDIKNRKLKAYDTRTSIFPDPKHILDYHKIDEYENDEVIVPEYDNLGNISAYKKMRAEINFDSLYNYTLVQDLFFDFEKEKLYSRLVAFIIRKKVVSSSGDYIGMKDYWGVIFPPEKKKIAKKTK